MKELDEAINYLTTNNISDILSEKQLREATVKFGPGSFSAQTGAEAIKATVKEKMELFGSVGKAE